MDEFVDARVFKTPTMDYIRKIKNLIRECEKYDVDYDTYIDRNELKIMIEQLECCIRHKDSRYIARIRDRDG